MTCVFEVKKKIWPLLETSEKEKSSEIPPHRKAALVLRFISNPSVLSKSKIVSSTLISHLSAKFHEFFRTKKFQVFFASERRNCKNCTAFGWVVDRMGGTNTKAPLIPESQLVPTGLYPNIKWEPRMIRKLILSKKLAPILRGTEESSADTEECPICYLVILGFNVGISY
jgi:hypothetical protein